MLKLALSGYGKMGHMVVDLAKDFQVDIVSIIDPFVSGQASEITRDNLSGAEVCIDFTDPSTVLENCRKIASCGVNIVIGTTGWDKDLEAVRDISKEYDVGILYGSNFSLGMNAFYHIVRQAAILMNKIPEYDVFGLELHHNQKKDSPSGTAKELSSIILDQMERKTDPLYETSNRKILPGELHFASVRAGYIPGTHTVGFDSLSDTIELTHRVRNRTGFALGALRGAMWIAGRKGMYRFSDVFQEIIGS